MAVTAAGGAGHDPQGATVLPDVRVMTTPLKGSVSTMKCSRIWKTRDGSSVPVAEMSDDHVFNTLIYLMRKVKVLEQVTDDSYAGAGGCRGEMATYYAAQGCDDAFKREHSCREWIEVFKREIIRRAS